MSHINKKLSGVTLVESLLYLALFAMVFTAIISFYFAIQDSNLQSRAIRDVDRTSLLIDEHFEQTFMEVDNIDTGSSFFDVNQSTLILNHSASIKSYYVQNGRLIFNIDGNSYYLSPIRYDITKFQLAGIEDRSTNTIGVRAEITFSDKLNPNFQKEYENSFILR